jgi:hypothetical protein
MKKSLILSFLIIFTPILAFAQQFNRSDLSDPLNYACSFSGGFTFLLSVVIGIIATILVLRSATKLKGGLFGIVLNYIGIGMFFLVLGAVSFIANAWFYSFWSDIIIVALLSLGFVFMVIGANKLLKAIMKA